MDDDDSFSIASSNIDAVIPGKEMTESFFQRHKQLIEYVRDSVSEEFYSLIVDSKEYSIQSKIGSGNRNESLISLLTVITFSPPPLRQQLRGV